MCRGPHCGSVGRGARAGTEAHERDASRGRRKEHLTGLRPSPRGSLLPTAGFLLFHVFLASLASPGPEAQHRSAPPGRRDEERKSNKFPFPFLFVISSSIRLPRMVGSLREVRLMVIKYNPSPHLSRAQRKARPPPRGGTGAGTGILLPAPAPRPTGRPCDRLWHFSLESSPLTC
jgi:hypothetical protein